MPTTLPKSRENMVLAYLVDKDKNRSPKPKNMLNTILIDTTPTETHDA
jgi:hypothetical protein